MQHKEAINLRKSKCDEYKREILELLELGVPKVKVAKKIGVNPATLHYWLSHRGYRGLGNHPLSPDAERIAEDMVARVANKIYEVASQEVGKLEKDSECQWFGNSHHVAQRIQGKIMEKMVPVIKNNVRLEVLR